MRKQVIVQAEIGLPPGVAEPEGFKRPEVALVASLDDEETHPGTVMFVLATGEGERVYSCRLADIAGSSYPEWWDADQMFARDQASPLYYVAGAEFSRLCDALGISKEYDSRG